MKTYITETNDDCKLLNPEVAATTLGCIPIANKNVTRHRPPPAPNEPARKPDINPAKLIFWKF